MKATGKYDEIYGQWLGVMNSLSSLLTAAVFGTDCFYRYYSVIRWAISLKQVVRIRTDDLALANETLISASQEDLQI